MPQNITKEVEILFILEKILKVIDKYNIITEDIEKLYEILDMYFHKENELEKFRKLIQDI